MIRILISIIATLMFCYGQLSAQTLSPETLKSRITSYKNDIRGPYQDIRWFCPDGSTRAARDPCPGGGGVQRARYKAEIVHLGTQQHLFWGQILATTPQADFWDAGHHHSRLKQYQLEKYLRAIDDGWILRKAQYYRGASQAEDESAWGKAFFLWLLKDPQVLQSQYFLLRQAIRDIPHAADSPRAQKIRALSKTLSDSYPTFMDLRVKIHGQPEAADLPQVIAFRQRHQSNLSAAQLQQFTELENEMALYYRPVDLNALLRQFPSLPANAPIRQALEAYIAQQGPQPAGADRSQATARLLWEIRQQLPLTSGAAARLQLLDLSLQLEELFLQELSAWETPTLKQGQEKIQTLAQVAAATGFLENWEWERIAPSLQPASGEQLTLSQLQSYLDQTRRVIEWGTGMVRATYEGEINTYLAFEPLIYGFSDDRIRASALLPLGQEASRLGRLLAQQQSLSHRMMNLSDLSQIRGVNPGYAKGKLIVVTDVPESVEVKAENIYLFDRPPADLKPLAGIATVTEGNMVSHVQLLARNLGIPNAVISRQDLAALKPFSGQEVFYAVGSQGRVIMKPVAEMSPTEQQLFAIKKRPEEKIRVPVEQMELSRDKLVNLRALRAKDSGKLCGPKAANLGQLKAIFPEQVVEGLVVPFGIFRNHMDQPMPGKGKSYWAYLNWVFQEANRLRSERQGNALIEAFVLGELAQLREAIKRMPLQPDFVQNLEQNFMTGLGQPLGKLPVFLRSDTNMEDLKDFTGAGLNLTLFNVVDRDKILQGIKDVWASPYTERSYKWRQSYLLNPENVYPSILIIPSVNVDYSGVLISKGIVSNRADDITVAFSRGVGGAVDGQAAESYLLRPNGSQLLLSPAREPEALRLPPTGGTVKAPVSFELPILSPEDLQLLRDFTQHIRRILPGTEGISSVGPYDVELGFENHKLWLFQVRPFVENKRALSSDYLQSISPAPRGEKSISLQSAY